MISIFFGFKNSGVSHRFCGMESFNSKSCPEYRTGFKNESSTTRSNCFEKKGPSRWNEGENRKERG